MGLSSVGVSGMQLSNQLRSKAPITPITIVIINDRINIVAEQGQKVKREPLNFPFKFASPNPRFKLWESEV